jgi:hypothetical protein
MPTLDPAPEPTAPTHDHGVVWFVADVAINLAWHPGVGPVVEIVRDKRTGEPHPAGEPLAIPASLADAFLAHFGPKPGSAGVSPEAAAVGRIPGLRRL